MPITLPPTYTPAGVFMPAGWDRTWKTALKNAGSALAYVNVYGASISHGLGSGTGFTQQLTHGYVARLVAKFVAAGYTHAGDFWPPTHSAGGNGYGQTWMGSGAFAAPWVVDNATNGQWVSSGYGKIYNYTAANATFPLLTFNSPEACTQMDFIYWNGVAGTFQYSLDDGSLVQITTTNTSMPIRVQLTGLANTTHKLEFGNGSVGQVMKIFGIATWKDTTKGIFMSRLTGGNFGLVQNIGLTGTDSYAQNGQAAPNATIVPPDMALQFCGWRSATDPVGFTGPPVKPHLSIIDPAAEIRMGVGRSGSQGALRRLVAAIRRGQRDASFLVIAMAGGNPDGTDPSANIVAPGDHGVNYPIYREVWGDVCSFNYGAYLDVQTRWSQIPGPDLGDVDSGGGLGYMVQGDVHPTLTGAIDLADFIWLAINTP